MNKELDVCGFLEEYWPLPKSIEDVLESIQNGEFDPHKYVGGLESKYGNDTITRYRKLEEGLIEIGTPEAASKLQDFVFSTGLSADIAPRTVISSRETLGYLLDDFIQEQPDSILDLGCGDGRIAIGLALYLDRLEKIYAVDKLGSALSRLRTNIQSLNEQDREKVGSKIVPIKDDYFNLKFRRERPKASVNLAINLPLFEFDDWVFVEQTILALSNITRDNLLVLSKTLVHDENDASAAASYSFTFLLNQMANKYGLNFSFYEHVFLNLNETLTICKGERMREHASKFVAEDI